MKLSKKDILTMKYDYDECPTVEFIRLDVVCEVVKELQHEATKRAFGEGISLKYVLEKTDELFGEVME